MQDQTERDPLLVAVDELRGGVDALRLPLDIAGASQARDVRQQLVEQLDDYVLPRLRALDAPLLAVVGGSTGAGKSTLVNSIVGEPVSRSGVLRPTTRSPVLVHHPDDDRAFSGGRILPRSTGSPGTSRWTCRTRSRLTPTSGSPLSDWRQRRPAGRSGAAGRARHRLRRQCQPGAGRPAARCRRPVDLRHDCCPLRGRRALGPAAGRRPSAGPRSRSCSTGCRRRP